MCLHTPLCKGTGRAIFRMLFPEEDQRRRYDMQEKKLAQVIISALHLSRDDAVPLSGWSGNDNHHVAGCFGTELQRILLLRVRLRPYVPQIMV